MEAYPPDLAGWQVSLSEISAGVYRIKIVHVTSGANFEMTGPDPAELIKRATEYSAEIDLGRHNR